MAVSNGEATPGVKGPTQQSTEGRGEGPLKAPESAVGIDGKIRYGWFDGPIRSLDLSRARVPGLGSLLSSPPAGGLRGLPGRVLRRARLKHWQYLSVTSEQAILGVAVAQLHYVANVFFYLFDRGTGGLVQRTLLSPFGRGVEYQQQSTGGATCFVSDECSVRLTSRKEEGTRSISIAAEGGKGKPSFAAEVQILDPADGLSPMVLLSDLGASRPAYTHKASGLPASGYCAVGRNRTEFREGESFACLDWTLAYSTRLTQWNWASAAGRAADGVPAGFNLSSGIYGGPTGGADENALWVDGALTKVQGGVRFEFNSQAPDDPSHPWRIESGDGRVRLDFVPLGMRSEDINLLVTRSRFAQPFGLFSGTLREEDGTEREVKELLGVVEDHLALW